MCQSVCLPWLTHPHVPMMNGKKSTVSGAEQRDGQHDLQQKHQILFQVPLADHTYDFWPIAWHWDRSAWYMHPQGEQVCKQLLPEESSYWLKNAVADELFSGLR